MDGQQQIADMMDHFRKDPPAEINGSKVITLLDYEMRKATDLLTGNTTQITLPKSNVLQFILADGSKISTRPSGTEPKIKFYFSVNTRLNTESEFKETTKLLDERIKNIISDMKL